MIYYFAAFFCFIFALFVDLSLRSDDWTRSVKISYGIVVTCGIIFSIAAIADSIIH